MTVKKNLDFIDVCKGIGILAVIVGHVFGGVTSKIMYIFHMPLFFFIGGFLFRERSEKKKYFIDKAYQLLVPYCVFLFFIISFIFYLQFRNSPITVHSLLSFMTLPLLGGVWLYGYAAVFWFVTVFFFTQQLFNLLVIRFQGKQLLGIMLLFLAIAYVNNVYTVKVPWDVNVIFMALPIFYIGYYTRKLDFVPNIFVVIAVSAVAIFLTVRGYSNTFDMKFAHYGIPVITLLSALALIYLIFAISKLLAVKQFFRSSLGELGKASMVIMYLHQPVQLIIRLHVTSEPFTRSIIAIGVSMLFYVVVKHFAYGRAFFLGSKEDFPRLSKAAVA